MPFGEGRHRQEKWEDQRRKHIADAKKRHEHLMQHEVPTPSSPFFENWKKELTDKGIELSEEEKRILFTFIFDFAWSGALQFHEGYDRTKEYDWISEKPGDTDVSFVDVPLAYSHDPGMAVFREKQKGRYVVSHVFRLRGKDYVITKGETTKEEKDETHWSGKKTVTTGTFFELGLVSTPKSLHEKQEDCVFDDFRKQQGYTQLLTLPTAPEYAQPLSTEELESDRDMLHRLKQPIGHSWNLRYLLYAWQGKMIPDDEFSRYVDTVDQSFVKHGGEEERRWQDEALEKYGYGRTDKGRGLLQAAIFLNMLGHSYFPGKGEKKEEEKSPWDAVSFDSKAARRSADELRRLPGFRMWDTKFLPTFKLTKELTKEQGWAREGKEEKEEKKPIVIVKPRKEDRKE